MSWFVAVVILAVTVAVTAVADLSFFLIGLYDNFFLKCVLSFFGRFLANFFFFSFFFILI